jgi:hypothetical protein
VANDELSGSPAAAVVSIADLMNSRRVEAIGLDIMQSIYRIFGGIAVINIIQMGRRLTVGGLLMRIAA